MDTGSLIVYIKTDGTRKDIAEDAENRFDTSNYELDRPCLKEQIKKMIGLMKSKSGGKIIINFFGLTAKSYISLIDDGNEDKKVKSTKSMS